MSTWSFLYYDILESGILNEKNKTVSFWEICVWIEKENDYWKSRKKETYRKMIKRNICTTLIIILIKQKRSTGVIIIKTKTKTIIIIIVKLFIIMTLSYHTVWWKNKLIHTHTQIWEYGYCFTYDILCLNWGTGF